MFQVLLGKKAKKSFEDLDEKIRVKALAIFDVLELNPWPGKEFDLSKIEGLQDCFRIRIGKYRICYQINTDAKEITVYRIELKSETTYK